MEIDALVQHRCGMRITRHITSLLVAVAAVAATAALPSAASAATPQCSPNRVCLYLHKDYGGAKRLEINPHAKRFWITVKEFRLRNEWHRQVSAFFNNSDVTMHAYDETRTRWPVRLWTMAPGDKVSFVGNRRNDRATKISR